MVRGRRVRIGTSRPGNLTRIRPAARIRSFRIRSFRIRSFYTRPAPGAAARSGLRRSAAGGRCPGTTDGCENVLELDRPVEECELHQQELDEDLLLAALPE